MPVMLHVSSASAREERRVCWTGGKCECVGPGGSVHAGTVLPLSIPFFPGERDAKRDAKRDAQLLSTIDAVVSPPCPPSRLRHRLWDSGLPPAHLRSPGDSSTGPFDLMLAPPRVFRSAGTRTAGHFGGSRRPRPCCWPVLRQRRVFFCSVACRAEVSPAPPVAAPQPGRRCALPARHRTRYCVVVRCDAPSRCRVGLRDA